MLRMMKTELWKLKRYHMVWAGVFFMLLSVLLTIFFTTAMDGIVWTFPFFTEQVIKNNATMIFPVCITLIAGYVIDREEKDDTLKSILTIPVSFPALLFGKLTACGLLSLFLGTTSAAFTAAASFLMGFPGCDLTAIIQAAVQITLNCLFLYIAVLPVITVCIRIPNGNLVGTIVAFVYGYGGMFAAGSAALTNIYPVTASLGLIAYRSYDPAVHWNAAACAASMLAALLVSAVFAVTAKKSAPAKTIKKSKQVITKKGW